MLSQQKEDCLLANEVNNILTILENDFYSVLYINYEDKP